MPEPCNEVGEVLLDRHFLDRHFLDRHFLDRHFLDVTWVEYLRRLDEFGQLLDIAPSLEPVRGVPFVLQAGKSHDPNICRPAVESLSNIQGMFSARLVVVRDDRHVPTLKRRVIDALPLASPHRTGRCCEAERRQRVRVLLAFHNDDPGCRDRRE